MASPHTQAVRRIASVLVISLLALPLGGCWDTLEVNDRGIIGALAFDRTPEGQYVMWAAIMEPIQFKGQAKPVPVRVLRGQSKTFEGALIHIQDQYVPRLYMGHLHWLVISDRLAKSGITDVVAWINRLLDRRLSQTLAVVDHSTIPRLLQIAPPGAHHSINVVREWLGVKTGESANLGPFLEDMYEAGRDSIAPIARPILTDHRLVQRDEVDFNGIALFREDQMVGTIDREDAVPFLMLHENIEKGNAVQSVVNAGPIERAAVSWLSSSVKRRVKIVNGRVRCEVQVTLIGRLSELKAPYNPYDEKERARVQKALAEAMGQRMERVFRKLQAAKVDSVGIGQLVHARYPAYWREVRTDWNEKGFQSVELVIQPRVKLEIQGLQRVIARPHQEGNEETFGAKPIR